MVQGTNVFFAAAFYVPELSLLGATQTANAAATTLAQSGDPVAAAQAGLDAAGAVAAENTRILERALTTPSTSGTGAGARSTSSEPADAAGAGAGRSATATVGATGSDDPADTSSTTTNSTGATDSTDSAGDGD